jgi:hypothetical protein
MVYAQWFLKNANREMGKNIQDFSHEVHRHLTAVIAGQEPKGT